MAGRKYNQGTYRYGFNGKEEDKEWGRQMIQDYGFRIYNPTIGKFLSVDPLAQSYPWFTPYQFAGNSVIAAIDLDGLEIEIKVGDIDDGKSVKINSTGIFFNNSGTNVTMNEMLLLQGFLDASIEKMWSRNNIKGYDVEAYSCIDVPENGNVTGTINIEDNKSRGTIEIFLSDKTEKDSPAHVNRRGLSKNETVVKITDMSLELDVDYFYGEILPILQKVEKGIGLNESEQKKYDEAARVIGHEFGHLLGLSHPHDDWLDAFRTENEKRAEKIYSDALNIMHQSFMVRKIKKEEPSEATNILPEQVEDIITNKVENAEVEIIQE